MHIKDRAYEVQEVTLHFEKFTLVIVDREVDGKFVPYQISLSGHDQSQEKINRTVDKLYSMTIH